MTRRIALAILATTWAALLAIGAGIYVAARHVMLTDLDASIVARAVTLPQDLGVSGATGLSSIPAGDRYLVKNAQGRTLARPTTSPASVEPRVLDRKFTTLSGRQRVRTLTLSLIAPNPADSVVVTYSSSAYRFDALLNRLVLWLVAIGLICGLAAAAAALVLSRLALRPLTQTAEQIGRIDEARLDRRIDVAALPPELQLMGDRLNEMLERLQRAFEAQTRFLADASHELRTPVAAISTTLEVALRRPRDAAALTQTLQSCLGDARSLRELVDRLMQQVRTQSTKSDVQPCDIAALLNECADTALRAADKPASIDRQLPPSLVLHTEPARLRSIVINLLTNAIEYGGGQVRLCAREIENDQLSIEVSDDGPGIPDDLLPRVFEPFARGSEHRDGSAGHLGLGLSIVQANVQAMGGSIRVSSEAGQGARFCVTLPAKKIEKSLSKAVI